MTLTNDFDVAMRTFSLSMTADVRIIIGLVAARVNVKGFQKIYTLYTSLIWPHLNTAPQVSQM